MGSQLAGQLVKAALKAGTEQSWAATAERIDNALQEVREVLDGLRSPVRPDYDHECWCVFPSNAFKTGTREAKCQRARELMKRLEVK